MFFLWLVLENLFLSPASDGTWEEWVAAAYTDKISLSAYGFYGDSEVDFDLLVSAGILCGKTPSQKLVEGGVMIPQRFSLISASPPPYPETNAEGDFRLYCNRVHTM